MDILTRTSIIKSIFKRSLVAAVLTTCCATTVMAADFTQYKKIAAQTIEQAKSGQINDIDALIAQQELLIKIGVNACNEYAQKNPAVKKAIRLVVSDVENMKQLSLHEIEEKWHDGGEFKKHGITIDDHFGELGSLIDSVIHPTTTYIALNKFKDNKNKNHLSQVVAELSEVLVHLDQFN